jgi:methyl-accepting chemotaxis protein
MTSPDMTDIHGLRARFACVLVALIWLNTGLLAFAAHVMGADNANLLVGCSAALAALTTLLWRSLGTEWLTRQVSSITAMGQVMLLVYAFAGHPYQSDMHMYFFAMLAVLAGWLDWRIFITATIAIAAHHSALSIAYPEGVFPNGNGAGRVLLHAVIVIVQASALSWIVHYLRVALVASETERRAATAARLVAEEARNEVATTTQKAAIERQSMLRAVADDFENKVAGIARDVSASVQTLRSASQQMMAGATEVAERSGAAATSSNHTSANVVAVTHATAELVTSIGEIDRQIAESARIVEATTAKARTVLETVDRLSRKADDVGNIVGTISTIAKQTDLLALNAAIEAARVGKLGSGFAVVAHEVKALANQTSQATEEIQGEIAAMRRSSEDASRAIDIMNLTIGSLNQMSAAVAVVMEQQNAATAGITRNIQVTANEAVTISSNIEIVSRVAAETGQAANYVAESADELARQSAHLDVEVAQFLGRIRAA